MKATLFSLSVVFSLLFSMVACQNLRTQRTMSSYDIRTEIVYTGGFVLEKQVASIITNAKQTKTMAMRESEID